MALLVLFVSALSLVVNIYWSPVLGNQLASTVLNSTDSLYSVSFSRSSLHFLQGKIVIEDIELKPNLAVYARKKRLHLAPNSLYMLNIKKLVIKHVHPIMLYFNSKLDIDQIVVSRPQLQVSFERNRDQDTVVKDTKTPYQLISKVLRSVHVNSILLNDVKFNYTDNINPKGNNIDLDGLNFSATDLRIDSTTQHSADRFLFCKDVSLELNDYNGITNSRRYQYKIGSLTFSTSSGLLALSRFSFGPVKSVNDFFEGNNDDCYAVSLDSLLFNHFDFKAYSKFHSIRASSVRLINGKFEMFSNPAPNDSTIDQSINFPQAILHRLKNEVNVDTVIANRMNVYYTEYNSKSSQYGTVSFNNINGNIYNITNNKNSLQKNNTARASLDAYLLNSAKMHTDFTFNLTDERWPFTYKGTVNAVDLDKINPLSIPLGMVRIATGNLNRLDFDMQADKNTARGTLTGLYKDLKITLMRKNDQNALRRMSLASFLANAIIIKRDNPSALAAAPRVANVVWQRRTYSSMFSFMWKSLLAGIKETVGYDAATERAVKQKITDFKQNKLERAARKARRIQRRAERRQRREQRMLNKVNRALNQPTAQN